MRFPNPLEFGKVEENQNTYANKEPDEYPNLLLHSGSWDSTPRDPCVAPGCGVQGPHLQLSSRSVRPYESSTAPQLNNNNYDLKGASASYPNLQSSLLRNNIMSLAYEGRHGGFADYPSGTIMEEPMHHDGLHQQQNQQYPSPSPITDGQYTNAHMESALDIGGMPDLPQKEDDDAGSPGRSKALMKPDREVTKGEDGRFVCSWNGCTEDIRSFNRKCEWSKHMDKHDRPYKCPAEGCEKLPGFTYSGGLLRHQREVHNLHGGPRKQLNCPHINCKRHSGKGFSRQENLNEHLRRVHTAPGDGEIPNPEETEDEGAPERIGMKRKRVDQGGRDDTNEMRENYNRLAQENADLRRQVDLQGAQIAELMHQIQAFSPDLMSRGMQNQAPQAMM